MRDRRPYRGCCVPDILAKMNDTELQILNFYCPNDRPLSLDTNKTSNSSFIAVGDFNSHSQSWGYSHMDRRGEEVEDWQDEHNLILINTPSDTPTFYSRRWRTTSTPDLAFCTEDLHRETQREVGEQLGSKSSRFATLCHSVWPESSGTQHPPYGRLTRKHGCCS